MTGAAAGAAARLTAAHGTVRWELLPSGPDSVRDGAVAQDPAAARDAADPV